MKQLFVALLLVISCVAPLTQVHAAPLESAQGLVNQAGESTYGAQEYSARPGLYTTLGNVVKVLLGLLGVVFIFLIIYAGFLWMTAAGNSDKIEKSSTILVQSIIGLIIVLAAYSITVFVLGKVGTATGTDLGVEDPNALGVGDNGE